ncbi:NAD(P)-binding protein [Magnetospirillum fulvum]|uniref:NADPH-dependent glutamate synthase beta chain n=1 Tax=Magnetospirillum fulvum TaxID=1082 RepID=A0A1H6HXT5_MAGFU|nr:NAD(P)-binding protein [Magnetospirillum fulvum]SEH40517.1 NADPH-dependent glutamate synthase beta chain [Magnetospirillum fulvum]
MTAFPAAQPLPAPTFRRYRDGDDAHRPWQEEIFQAGWSHKCPTYVHKTSPCQAACPSGHDIRGWLAMVRGRDVARDGTGWQEAAFRRMVEANPFPAVMGRVCPAPCEDGCNRNEVEDAVGINAVEHFIGDWALAQGLAFDPPPADSGKRVVVVGGGPAGLAASYHLRRRGHCVTILESQQALGGMMRFGIPGYRTPRPVLDGEIDRILALGIEVRLGVRVGRDVALADLEREFDAIFWAIGTHSGRGLPVPGADAPNCISGIAFLRAYNQGRLQTVTGRVVVIGGGDTSIDVASVARRLGHVSHLADKDRPETVVLGQTAHDVAASALRQGAHVVLTSLFPVEKMMAAEREIVDATREGVEIIGGVMPLEVLTDGDGRARAIRLCRCEMEGTAPRPLVGTEFEIECDLVVAAIGQKGDLADLPELDSGTGFIAADRSLAVPGRRGHFVGGDIVRPHLLTSAIGHGRLAADSIDRFLSGEEARLRRPKVEGVLFDLPARLAQDGLASADGAIHNYEDRAPHEVIPHEDLFLAHFAPVARHARPHVEIEAGAVLGNFDERLGGLSEAEAIDEAKRCIGCGLCLECDNCLIYCPQHAVERLPKAERAPGRYVRTDYSRCIGCHICHDVCPSGYIQMGLGE